MAFTFYYINLIILIIMLIPSVIFQAKRDKESKDGNEEEHKYHNRPLERIEKFGRYGTMSFYVIKLEDRKSISTLSYAIIFALLILYIALWIFFWNKDCLKRAITLSVIPSILFLASAIIDRNYPLLLFALIFAPAHIAISIKSYEFESKLKSIPAS